VEATDKMDKQNIGSVREWVERHPLPILVAVILVTGGSTATSVIWICTKTEAAFRESIASKSNQILEECRVPVEQRPSDSEQRLQQAAKACGPKTGPTLTRPRAIALRKPSKIGDFKGTCRLAENTLTMRIDVRAGAFAACCADFDEAIGLREFSEAQVLVDSDTEEPAVEIKLEDCSEHVLLVDKEPAQASVPRIHRLSIDEKKLFPTRVCLVALDSHVGANTLRLREIILR